jgi:hypothetical protein
MRGGRRGTSAAGRALVTLMTPSAGGEPTGPMMN